LWRAVVFLWGLPTTRHRLALPPTIATEADKEAKKAKKATEGVTVAGAAPTKKRRQG